MASKQVASIQRFIRKTADQCRDQQVSDRELLRRFVQQGDEDAFAALVRRYGAMVLGVGLRVLYHRQDAEDVRQATFLLLARKAHAVAWRDCVANWLYTAAYHLALQSRDAANRRIARVNKVKLKPPPDALADISLRELQTILDEELARLPKKYSAPLLLCCLEGKARDEAAQCLGWQLATLKSRLEDGRELLRRRLACRGLELSAVLAGVALTSGVGRAALPAMLVQATSCAAVQVLGGKMTAGVVSANAMSLVKGAVQTMIVRKLTMAAVLLLAVGAVATGIIAVADSAPQAAKAQTPKNTASPAITPDDALPQGALTRFGGTRWRHGGVSGFVAFAPDGKTVVSASDDQVFHVWEFPSGKEIRRFGPGVNGPVPPAARIPLTELPVALSADGKIVACHFGGGEILVYNVATGAKLATLGEPGEFSHIAFSPDGGELADRDWLGQLTIWDWKAGKKQDINVRHRFIIGEVPSLTYAPNGKLLAMTANYVDGTHYSKVQLVDPRQPKEQQVRTIQLDPPTYVSAVLFSPDSKLLACTDRSGVVRLLDVATGKQLSQIRGPERGSVSMAFSRDGNSMVTRSFYQQTVRAWDLASGKELRSFGPLGKRDSQMYDRMLPRPALSPDGAILAFAGIDHALHFLDLGTGEEVHAEKSNTLALYALGFAPDGRRLWAKGCGKALRQWDWTSGTEVDPIPLPIDTSKAALDANAKYLVTTPWDTKAGRIIRVADGKQVGQIPPPQVTDDHARGPESAILSPDGALLAMRWERAQRLELYAIPGGKLLHTFGVAATQREMAVNSLACWPTMLFSPEGRLLAAYSSPGVLSFWDTNTGQKRADLSLTDVLPLAGVAFTPDGRSLALEKSDGSVVLWELASLKRRRVFVARDAPPTPANSRLRGTFKEPFAVTSVNVAFSPAGDLVVLGAPDGGIHIWDLQTGAELAVFRGHSGVINAFAFSPNGKTLASASSDTSVLTWDLSDLASRPMPRRVFTQAELQTRWELLVGDDAEGAFTAMCDLAAAPTQTVAFLNQRMKPAPALDLERVNRHIADLGDPAFKVREKAIADLLQLNREVVPLIDKALASGPVLEVQLRLKKIRSQLTSLLLTSEALRLSRAVEVLERIATPEARRLLERLVGGAPGALTTTNARAALDRLASRIK